MKFQTNVTATKEVDIPVPSFFREKSYVAPSVCSKMIALLDEKTQVSVFLHPDRRSIINDIPDGRELTIAHETWDKITEEEFMNAFYEVYDSLNLMPVKI